MRIRGVAQPGRVLGLGPRCRRFEPSHPDQRVQTARQERFFIWFPISSPSSRVAFFKMAIFSLFSNSLVSNFNGFCMVLMDVRNEEL